METPARLKVHVALKGKELGAVLPLPPYRAGAGRRKYLLPLPYHSGGRSTVYGLNEYMSQHGLVSNFLLYASLASIV